MTALLLILAVVAQTVAPPAAPEAAWGVKGVASHVGYGYGRHYLALPSHKWGRPGIRVRICDIDAETPGSGCVTRTSTDAGPALFMQRAGRIADVNRYDFEAICGCDGGRGLIRVELTYGLDSGGVEPRPTIPPTDTISGAGSSSISTDTMSSARLVARPNDGGRFAFRRV